MKIVYGFFSGIGDLFAASPVIEQISKIHETAILVSGQASKVTSIASLRQTKKLQFTLASSKNGMIRSLEVLKCISEFQPDHILISPHAVKKQSSWKIPIACRLACLTLPKCKVHGSAEDRLSILYDVRYHIDKSKPLRARELCFIQQVSFLQNSLKLHSDSPQKLSNLEAKRRNCIAIHPGASRLNKQWPSENYKQLLMLLRHKNPHLNFTFLGLNKDLDHLRHLLKEVPGEPPCFFIEDLVAAAKYVDQNCSVYVGMDSGFAHLIADTRVPVIALFGSTNPESILPKQTGVSSIMVQAEKCQPCEMHSCHKDRILCMEAIGPELVANCVLRYLA